MWEVEYYKPDYYENHRTITLRTAQMERFMAICNMLGLAALGVKKRHAN